MGHAVVHARHITCAFRLDASRFASGGGWSSGPRSPPLVGGRSHRSLDRGDAFPRGDMTPRIGQWEETGNAGDL